MSAAAPADAAAVVLVGGGSRRMGAPKEALPWQGGTLLQAVLAALAPCVAETVVVGAPGRDRPALPAGVASVADRHPGHGPLEGLAAGLEAVAPRRARALVVPVDLPFLTPELARRLLAGLAGDAQVAAPVRDGRARPLPAAYRTDLAPAARELLAAGERRLGALLDRCRVVALSAGDLLADPALAAADPGLRGLTDVDTPSDWAAARRLRGTRTLQAGVP